MIQFPAADGSLPTVNRYGGVVMPMCSDSFNKLDEGAAGLWNSMFRPWCVVEMFYQNVVAMLHTETHAIQKADSSLSALTAQQFWHDKTGNLFSFCLWNEDKRCSAKCHYESIKALLFDLRFPASIETRKIFPSLKGFRKICNSIRNYIHQTDFTFT